MSRIEIIRRAFREWSEKVEALPSDERGVAYIVAILAVVVTIVAIIGIIALILSVIKAFWWVLVLGVVLWYFWPRLMDFLKKNPR